MESVTPREELVLRALEGAERYSLQIQKAIEEATGRQCRLGVGVLYPVLHKLENKGLIQSRWGDERRDERGGARRRYYKLTDAGAKAMGEVRSSVSNSVRLQPSQAV